MLLLGSDVSVANGWTCSILNSAGDVLGVGGEVVVSQTDMRFSFEVGKIAITRKGTVTGWRLDWNGREMLGGEFTGAGPWLMVREDVAGGGNLASGIVAIDRFNQTADVGIELLHVAARPRRR